MQKTLSFPIRLYDQSRSWAKGVSVCEARATIHPRSNQRPFEVTVQEMKELDADEVKTTRERCMSKTGQETACKEAFVSWFSLPLNPIHA